ncbi:MAG: FAD-dependent oxidoreductase [Ferruginibacter sp.]|nr:FAD-dependent oxidoreductase [Ferruginibacter sp.]
MALQPWRIGKVTRIENETADTRRFWIEVPELTVFNFIPGQFVTLDLPVHEKPNKRWRSYSIASWPDGTNIFELVIVLDDNGAGTPYLFNEVKVGSEISFRGPQGVFTLKEQMDEDLVLICTGTGIAPFRSMVHHIHNNNIPHKNIYLVFGCRTKSSLLYYEEMSNLQKEMHGFHYIPTLSREQWDGYSGYVHAVYELVCIDRQPAKFYLCGWKGMIDEARTRIVGMGYDKKAVHFEIYG